MAISEDSSIAEVVVGGAWIFLSTVIVSLSGFALWVIISRLLGVGVVGVTSAAVSAAGVASTLVAAGLPVAVMREVAARGPEALLPAAATSLILGAASALLAYVMVSALPTGFGIPAWVPAALAFATVASTAALQALIGLGRFRAYFTSTLAASAVKLVLGVGLALIGWGLLAPLVGYVAFPVTALIAASVILALTLRVGGFGGRGRFSDPGVGSGVLSVLKLAYSNYPFVFSSQVLNMLSVYFFAVLTASAINTGILYLSLMIVLILNAVAGSALSASLSVSLRRGADPFAPTLRLALAVTAPLAAAVSAAPTLPLRLINPALVGGASTLTILALTIPPTATLSAVVMKANREGRHALLATLGLLRLATLVALLFPLTREAGTDGVALAYLVANIAPLPTALRNMPQALKPLTVAWGAQAALTLTALTLAPNPTPAQAVVTALTTATATLAVTHVSGTTSVKEIIAVVTALARRVVGK